MSLAGSSARWSGLFLWLATSVGLAEPLRVDRSAETMRVDGALREWKGAQFATLGAGDDASVRFALASQADGLYLAAEIRDDQLVRKASAGAGQDALVLALALPADKGTWRGVEVWLHAGRQGREKALAGFSSLSPHTNVGPAPGVKVVEGPRDTGNGYVLEAFIPFLLFGAADNWEQARAVLRYEDVDSHGQQKAATTLRSSPEARPEQWPAIVLGSGQVDLLASFLETQGLSGVAARFDARANVAGDASDERVVIVDKFVLVYGKHFKDGQGYSYFALPYSVGGGLVSAELLDLTEDGRAELLTRVRQVNPLGARVLLSVLSLGEDAITPLFSLELKKEVQGGFIENELRVDKKARPPQLQVRKGRALGLTKDSYHERPASDAAPILLPWGELEAESYAFQSGKFVRVDQRMSKSAAPAAPERGVVTAENARESTLPVHEPPAANGDPIVARIVSLARGEAPPADVRFKQEANLCGTARPELVFAYQRRIVVSGTDLGPAGSYLAYGLPLGADADLLTLASADLGSDGRAELLARYRQTSTDGLLHEMLVVLALEANSTGGGFRPLLLVELARHSGDKAIVNEAQVSAGVLTIAPGKAQGYTRETYPFNNEPMKGIERLLLPWLDGPRRYRVEGGRLRAE